MLRRLLGRGSREEEPRAQVLVDEREAVHNAIKLATETGSSQPVKIDQQKYVIESNGYGTQIKPASLPNID